MIKILFISLALITSANFVDSSIASEEFNDSETKILKTYNMFYSSVYAANICGAEKYSDKKEEANFKRNFAMIRAQVAKALMRVKPDYTKEDAYKNILELDGHNKNGIETLHKVEGCKNKKITTALGWFEDFKKLTPFPVNMEKEELPEEKTE